MKIHLRNRGAGEKEAIDKEVARQAAKLGRQLRKFNPDLVDVHINIAKRKQGIRPFTASVTLSLPAGRMHAKSQAARPVTALKESFAELIRELKKYKAKLRGDNHVRRESRTRRRVMA